LLARCEISSQKAYDVAWEGTVKKLLFVILLILAAYLFYRWWNSNSSTTDGGRGEALLYDRVWIDHMPKTETETFQIFLAINDQRLGLFQQSSTWKGAWEVFKYEPSADGRLTITFPQTRETERAGYRAVKCNERGFDYCLELQGNSRGTRRYFSRKGWEIDGAKTPEALRERVAHLLPAVE
jgi:hypothetical protein